MMHTEAHIDGASRINSGTNDVVAEELDEVILGCERLRHSVVVCLAALPVAAYTRTRRTVIPTRT